MAESKNPSESHLKTVSMYFDKRNGQPTLMAYPDFKIKIDVENIIKAFENGDKYVIISVLCNRSIDQRLEIADFYQSLTGIKITKSIKSLYRSDLAKLMCGLAVPYYEYLAHTIIHSRSFRWLYYILFTVSNQEITQMKEHFQKSMSQNKNFLKIIQFDSKNNSFELEYNETVEKFICQSKDTDPANDENQLERIVIGPIMKMLQAKRCESDVIDLPKVLTDVIQLEKITGGSYFENSYEEKQIVKNIFHYKSFAHIKAVCEEYSSRNGGTSIQDQIQKAYTYSFANDNIYNCFIKFATKPVYYHSYCLKKSMKNLGTNDRLLSHIVVRRSEIDMMDVKKEFLRLYGESLRTWVKGDTSGHYKYALYKLIGEYRSK